MYYNDLLKFYLSERLGDAFLAGFRTLRRACRAAFHPRDTRRPKQARQSLAWGTWGPVRRGVFKQLVQRTER